MVEKNEFVASPDKNTARRYAVAALTGALALTALMVGIDLAADSFADKIYDSGRVLGDTIKEEISNISAETTVVDAMPHDN